MNSAKSVTKSVQAEQKAAVMKPIIGFLLYEKKGQSVRCGNFFDFAFGEAIKMVSLLKSKGSEFEVLINDDESEVIINGNNGTLKMTA